MNDWIERPWGHMTLYAHGDNFWIKKIHLNAGQRTSLQKHAKRGELWMCVEGEVTIQVGKESWNLVPFKVTRFGRNMVHRLSSERGGTIIEIGYGECDEDDIIRIEDDYGRAAV